MIELKTAREIELMRVAGRVVGELLEHLGRLVQPGIKTRALDEAARDFFKSRKVQSAFLGYRGYPACICVSVNEEVVHGIPGPREIRDGDLVSIDVGAIVEGYYGDAAKTFAVGGVPAPARRLMETTRRALEEGVSQMRDGSRLSDISHAVQCVVEREGFSVVKDFVGHGIGQAMHEDPPVPNYGEPHMGPRLQTGMVLAIEPMVTLGAADVRILDDGWTAVTQDGSLAAHFEHTVALTDDGVQVLTALENGERRRD